MELAYSYPRPSQLSTAPQNAQLELATSGGTTDTRLSTGSVFFSGFVEHPVVLAQSLLVLARVARTRYYVPPNMLAAILRAADPVVTATGEGLRLESFSACCGVYARLDVDAEALATPQHLVGVTNVDVNPPLRRALAGLRPGEPLHLRIGEDGVSASTLDGEVVEQKVPLPRRWVKGFAEAQMLMSGMALRHEVEGPAARRFVRELPRTSVTSSVPWISRTSRGVRLASRPGPGAVAAAGPERLRALEPLMRFATTLRAYGPAASEGSGPLPSAWVVEMPGARFTLALSPQKARGFSGEGSLLHALASRSAAADADLVSALLAFDAQIDPARLAREAGLDRVRIDAALAVLASRGQVGYDLTTGAYFHRPLPMRTEELEEIHPRLREARALLADGAVQCLDGTEVAVTSRGTTHRIRLGDSPHEDICTCPWYAAHQGGRGPCKHVLAARLGIGTTTEGPRS